MTGAAVSAIPGSMQESPLAHAQSVFRLADPKSTGTVPLRTLSDILPFPRDDLLALLERSNALVVRYKQFFNWLFDRANSSLDEANDSYPSQKPDMPVGMTALPNVTPAMQARQWLEPEKWALPMSSWSSVINHCKTMPEYQKVKSNTGFVNLYELNNLAVKPWTEDTGCGLAILMTQESAVSAGLMISHCWGEDLEECQSAVDKYVMGKGVPGETPVWFCIFANYQCQDEIGPSIQAQLDMQPFQRVITSVGLKEQNFGYGMIAVHTTREDLYSRLWCVHEVDAALREGIHVGAAMSDSYITETLRRIQLFSEFHFDAQSCLQAAGIRVNTVKARCGNPDDERLLIRIITEAGGFSRLDTQIEAFRIAVLPEEVKDQLFPPDQYSEVAEDEEVDNQSEEAVPRLSQDEPSSAIAAEATEQQSSFNRMDEESADEAVAHAEIMFAASSFDISGSDDCLPASNRRLNTIGELQANAELPGAPDRDVLSEELSVPSSDIECKKRKSKRAHHSDHHHHGFKKGGHKHLNGAEMPWSSDLCRKGSSTSMSSEAEFARMVGRKFRGFR